MSVDTYSIKTIDILKQMIKTNNEVNAFLVEKNQYDQVLKEIDNIIKGIKSGELKTIYMPSVGNILKPVKSSNKDVMKMYLENKEKYETAIKGIEGQMSHRKDLLNELSIKCYRSIMGFINENGLKIPREFTKKPDEMPTAHKEKK